MGGTTTLEIDSERADGASFATSKVLLLETADHFEANRKYVIFAQIRWPALREPEKCAIAQLEISKRKF